jgi:predicted acylesterase/phospholipase RssA
MGADVVIAVSVDPTIMTSLEDQSIISIMQRCDLIRSIHMSRMQIEKADAVIHPDVADCHWSRFLECDRFIDAGIRETIVQLPLIRRLLKKRTRWIEKVFNMLRQGGN